MVYRSISWGNVKIPEELVGRIVGATESHHGFILEGNENPSLYLRCPNLPEILPGSADGFYVSSAYSPKEPPIKGLGELAGVKVESIGVVPLKHTTIPEDKRGFLFEEATLTTSGGTYKLIWEPLDPKKPDPHYKAYRSKPVINRT
ncbi:MAG: hypothetical protein JW727_00545 [Candidatus Aenigmarchaeota archaeon]|nr:hypothetical protein [Candidatus Aenigmarchaeota archaeon]